MSIHFNDFGMLVRETSHPTAHTSRDRRVILALRRIGVGAA